jgi:hypothetical protein
VAPDGSTAELTGDADRQDAISFREDHGSAPPAPPEM